MSTPPSYFLPAGSNQDAVWSDFLIRTLTDLMFVSKIEVGQKPCFVKRTYVDADSWYGSAYRSFYSESGRDAFQQCRKIFHIAMQQHAMPMDKKNKGTLYHHIHKASKGLNSLIQTYERVPEVHDSMTVLLHEVLQWLNEHIMKDFELDGMGGQRNTGQEDE